MGLLIDALHLAAVSPLQDVLQLVVNREIKFGNKVVANKHRQQWRKDLPDIAAERPAGDARP